MANSVQKSDASTSRKAYQSAILQAMELPLFALKQADASSPESAEPCLATQTEGTSHPNTKVTLDIQTFLAEAMPHVSVFVHDSVLVSQDSIGLPENIQPEHKKQLWSELKTYLQAQSDS